MHDRGGSSCFLFFAGGFGVFGFFRYFRLGFSPATHRLDLKHWYRHLSQNDRKVSFSPRYTHLQGPVPLASTTDASDDESLLSANINGNGFRSFRAPLVSPFSSDEFSVSSSSSVLFRCLILVAVFVSTSLPVSFIWSDCVERSSLHSSVVLEIDSLTDVEYCPSVIDSSVGVPSKIITQSDSSHLYFNPV